MALPKGSDLWRGQVRVPRPIADWLKIRAEQSFRSVNAEFVEVLREAMNRERNAQTTA